MLAFKKFNLINIGSFVYPLTFRCVLSTTIKESTEDIIQILKTKFPKAKTVEVVDVSGGCGAMYEVLVESQDFKGMPIVKQHRMINEALKEQIKEMHGLRIHTLVPKEDGT